MAQTQTREPGTHTVTVTVNGTRYSRPVEPRQLLVYFIREQLGLTGTHVGCDTSNCGACTVHLDGRSVKSCNVLAVQADGGEVTTIEGLAQDGELHPVQEAMVEANATQCGFCTPGFVMSLLAVYQNGLDPTPERIDDALAGTGLREHGHDSRAGGMDDGRWRPAHHARARHRERPPGGRR